jgi:hypothetical protein
MCRGSCCWIWSWGRSFLLGCSYCWDFTFFIFLVNGFPFVCMLYKKFPPFISIDLACATLLCNVYPKSSRSTSILGTWDSSVELSQLAGLHVFSFPGSTPSISFTPNQHERPIAHEGAVVPITQGLEYALTCPNFHWETEFWLVCNCFCCTKYYLLLMVVRSLQNCSESYWYWKGYFYCFQIKGQGIYAFVTLLEGVEYSQQLRASLVNAVRTHVRGHLWLTAVSKSHLQVGLLCKDKEFTSFKSECYLISLCHLPRLQIAGFWTHQEVVVD